MKEIKKIELIRTFWETKSIITIYNVTFDDDTIIVADDENISRDLHIKCVEFMKYSNDVHWKKRKVKDGNLKGERIFATYENI